MSAIVEPLTRRWRFQIQGIVQGVGFRPFVYSQAVNLGLVGFVLNDSNGVTIEVEGHVDKLKCFRAVFSTQLPLLARIDVLTVEQVEPCYETSFQIQHSQSTFERSALISPDTAMCADCLRELFTPDDRRYHYPFINCTNCGPRFTIIQNVPYDREQTTMSVFPMCPACQAEYDDPRSRRFHAQPNACPQCGPQVSLRTGDGSVVECADPIAAAAEALVNGKIVAVKGLGGYHLACDALNSESVTLLRQRKRREARPFALMVPDLATAQQLCDVQPEEAELLQSYRRAIVLLRQKEAGCVADEFAVKERILAVAEDGSSRGREGGTSHAAMAGTESKVSHPGAFKDAFKGAISSAAEASSAAKTYAYEVGMQERNFVSVAYNVAHYYDTLGIMLPYTPLHYLLLAAVAECRAHTPVVLVMTSANLSDEPIVYRDVDAFARLGTIADLLLVYNRAIHMRCDDSVMRIMAGKEQFVRRSRGFAPEPVPLSQTCEIPLLACGGHLKNTFALSKGQQVFVSHHIGDLDNLETLLAYREGIEHYKTLFGIAPQAIVYDLHPEYLATKYALESEIPTQIGVQHHHAHIASVIAEHGLTGPVIGVAADGTGYGLDGAVWGCEVMLADLCDFTRLAHLAYVPLPGGEQAVRQPWRMAVAYLQLFYNATLRTLDLPFIQRCDPQSLKIISRMIMCGLNAPLTSSLGRLFDAVAALLLVRQEVAYEGQAAIELEIIATQALGAGSVLPYPFAYKSGQPALLDVAETIRAIVEDIQRGVPVAQIALRFHQTIACLLLEACMQARLQSGIIDVALSGGVFQNKLLLELLSAALQKQGFNVYTNQRVPPNDGGLAYGQLAVAAARLRAGA